MIKKVIPIKYTSREFNTIKRDLIDHAKRYYENSHKDFSEANFGSMMLESVAYIGDILSYYVDYQANECFLDTAIEYDNIVKLGKQLGYKHKNTSSATGIASFYIKVPVSLTNAPDTRYMPILKAGSMFGTPDGLTFILTEDVDFKTAKEISGINNNSFAIKAYGKVVSGKIGGESIDIGDFEKFKKVSLSTKNILEILSVYDSEGNEYFEVPNLSQNVIYKPITNKDSSSSKYARQVLKPFLVPRRFVVENDFTNTFLQFGGSSDIQSADSAIAEPVNTILNMYGKNYISDTSFDPSRILNSDKLGVAPSNTKILVTFRYLERAGGINYPSNSLTERKKINLEFSDIETLNSSLLKVVEDSLEVGNDSPLLGDVNTLTSQELKRRMQYTFAAQDRAVTVEDYKAISYAMPANLGSIKRVNVIRDDDSFKRNLNIYVLSEDTYGKLIISNESIKQNLKEWLSSKKMINDSIDILDGKIVNYGIEFKAMGSKTKSNYEILAAAINQISKDFYTLPDFGEPFIISNVFVSLKKIPEIIDVIEVKIVEKIGKLGGMEYSQSRFSFERNMSQDKRFINVPLNVVLELKYPSIDIKGTIL